MSKKRKIIIAMLVVVFALLFISSPVYAVTEDEVKTAVNNASKESVSGNVFIWFLCAIAFLKISQKIDSFMSSLGINVGHTGGNMMAEMVIAARGVGEGKRLLGGGSGGGGKGGGSSGGSGGSGGGFLSGGLAGAVNRNFNKSAVNAATNQGGNAVTRNAFQSSMAKGGSFANSVIGSVAKGNVSQMGSITGETASQAMSSYMGFTGQEGAPSFSDVEIGGGRITGTEFGETAIMNENISNDDMPHMPPPTNSGSASGQGASPDTQSIGRMSGDTVSSNGDGGSSSSSSGGSVAEPSGTQFAMYNTDQYMAPEHGSYDVVEAKDGSKWYRQYAQDTVEKTPYRTDEGKIRYNENIVQKMPPMPKRKDRV